MKSNEMEMWMNTVAVKWITVCGIKGTHQQTNKQNSAAVGHIVSTCPCMRGEKMEKQCGSYSNLGEEVNKLESVVVERKKRGRKRKEESNPDVISQ